MAMVPKTKLHIDGKNVEVNKGKTVLQEANSIGIRIPNPVPRPAPGTFCGVPPLYSGSRE